MKIKNLLFMLTIMLIGFVGINNVKAAESYGLWVNGEEFTSEKTIINCGSGTATFDNSTKTLTLNNATIDVNYDSGNYYGDTGIGYEEHNPIYDSSHNVVYRDIKLVLNGINTINSKYYAIFMEANLDIEGTGTLNINLHTSDGDNDRTIEVGNLTINDATININSGEGLSSIEANGDYANDNSLFSNAEINNANISITNGCMSFYSTNLHINNSTIIINNTTTTPDGYENHGIFALKMEINGDTNINISGVKTGIETIDGGDDDWGSLWINDGNITISASSAALSGGVNLDNYDKKIMGSFEPDGTNSEVLSNSDFDTYYSFVKMGDFDTYKITNKPTTASIGMPNEAFEGEPVLVDNWFAYAYAIDKVQILKTSDNSDITEEVGYDKKTHKFIMPAYPVTVKTTTKVIYAAVPKTIAAKLDKYNAVKVSWTRDNNSNNNYFDGCYIYYKKSTESTWKKITWTLKSYYTKTDLEPGVKYNFKIVPLLRFYGTDGKVKNIESTKYKLINIYTLKKMNLPTITKYDDFKVQVKWKTVDGASGYQIARSVYKTRNYSVVKTVNNKYIGYKLDTKANKTYYYKVRAYRLSNGTKVYGPWSNYKSFRLQ